MRTKTSVLAILALSGLWLAGCDNQKATSAPAASAQAAYPQTLEGNAKYLADNKVKPGVVTRPSGLQYRVIKSGNGKSPTSGNDMVTVSYKGWTVDGNVFDQTSPGETRQFPAGALIPGWVEALSLMKEGDEWELTIPADIGYGAEGAGGVIPGGATLVFTMTLVAVQPAAQ